MRARSIEPRAPAVPITRGIAPIGVLGVQREAATLVADIELQEAEAMLACTTLTDVEEVMGEVVGAPRGDRARVSAPRGTVTLAGPSAQWVVSHFQSETPSVNGTVSY